MTSKGTKRHKPRGIGESRGVVHGLKLGAQLLVGGAGDAKRVDLVARADHVRDRHVVHSHIPIDGIAHFDLEVSGAV